MKTVACVFATAGLLVLADVPRAAAQTPEKAAPVEWSALLERCEEAGLDRRRLRTIRERCTRAGVSAQAAWQMLLPAQQAADKALPTASILAKVEEGVAKNVEPAAVAQAAQLRLRHMIAAGSLVDANVDRVRDREAVTIAAAYALESGVQGQAVTALLGRAAHTRARSLTLALQAGEALHLAGLDDEAVQALMIDCVERNLRRSEVNRAVQFARMNRERGMTGMQIRSALWGGDGQADRERRRLGNAGVGGADTDRAARSRPGQASATAPTPGPGPGGPDTSASTPGPGPRQQGRGHQGQGSRP